MCKVRGEDTVFLQQASHLTSGAYLRLDHPSGLLQYLMVSFPSSPLPRRTSDNADPCFDPQTTFLPGRSTRKHIQLPVQEQVDLRAACFCHRKIVDVGFVCSLCLSSAYTMTTSIWGNKRKILLSSHKLVQSFALPEASAGPARRLLLLRQPTVSTMDHDRRFEAGCRATEQPGLHACLLSTRPRS